MSDPISRQDAIDAINQYGSVWMEYTDSMSREEVAERALKASKQSMIKILHDLPSAQRKGKWIPLFGEKFVGGAYWFECSKCKRIVPEVRNGGWNYCPNCGASMVRGEEDE